MARTQLPGEVDAFVGRREDLARLDAAYDSGERLIAIIGPGGMGKTRLAVRWARANAGRFSATVFCDLAPARDAGALSARLALALAVPAGNDEDKIERLGEQLAGHGDVLVVLDNFEQLASDGALAVARLHELAPRALLLVTTRSALGVRGEVRLELGPIALPDERATPSRSRESDAMLLLCDRVRRLDGSFGEEEAELRIATELVRRLDGIPLAIELAASRVAVLGARATLDRLVRSIDALGTGPTDAVARQRTMRSTIEWSLDLLTDEDRAAFALAGVFLGPFEADAVEAVFPGDRALDRVLSLASSSLLRTWEPPGLAGERRFSFYEPIRAVARERFEAHPDADRMRRRHAQYFVGRGELLAEIVDRGGRRDVLVRLALMEDDLVAAAETLLATGSSTLAARAVLALSPILAAQGLYGRLRDLQTRALAELSEDKELIRADLLARSAVVLAVFGERAGAIHSLETAIAIAQRNDDKTREGRFLREIARILSGAPEEAGPYIERAIAILREAGDARDLGLALSTKGARRYEAGEPVEAEALFTESIRILHASGDVRWEGIARCQLAIVMLDAARWDEARAMLAGARRCAEIDGAWNVAVMVDHASVALAHALGELDEARSLYASIIDTHRRVNDRSFVGIYVGYQGVIERESGAHERAASLLTEACDILAMVGERWHRALFLSHLASVRAAAGRIEEAVRGYDEAERSVREGPYEQVRRVIAIERAHLALATRPADVLATLAEGEPGIDERISRRILQRAIERAGRHSSPPPLHVPRQLLRVEREARFVEPPGAARISLATRQVARRLLLALVEARHAHPGRPVSVDALIRAGWPGERIYAEAAKNRLHVGVSTLRKLGLGDLLARDGDGYYIDPRVEIELVD